MPTFVSDIVSAMSSTTVGFATSVINSYWTTILGIGLIVALAGYFIRLARIR